ncbi:MAG: metallophosphoesterase [Clostridia bacterium]|nr:metallophosphoesterase [Clostridia bacterium]
MKRKTTFYHITDSHLLSPDIWVEGGAIDRRERGDQIALKATPQILDAFIEKILADDEADAVLFTGDNVNEGDVQSHEAFRARLERLTAAGKRVFVTSATHDYCGAGDDENTFRACRYTKDGTEPIPFLRKGELFGFYYDYGPKQAIDVHRESGSYVVRLCDGVRLAMIGDNGNGRSHCGLFEDGMRWLQNALHEAREAGEYVLLAVHHPVLPPWEVFRHMADYELFGGYRELYEMMCAENVRVVFTGHTHLQSIRKYTDSAGRWFLDVSTIALANAAGKMRRVTADADSGVCTVRSVGIETLPGADAGGRSPFECLYGLNFPGILERLLPLGAHDFDAFLALADGFLPAEKLRSHKKAIRFACRRLERMKLSAAARLSATWKKLTPAQRKSAGRERLTDVVFEVLRHIYPGNAPYPPGTVEHTVFTGCAEKLDRFVRRFHIEALQKLVPPGSSFAEIVQDFLYNNRTGDDDAICFSLREADS